MGESYASQTPLSLCLARRLVSCDMREDFFPIELDELGLLWADLMDVHVTGAFCSAFLCGLSKGYRRAFRPCICLLRITELSAI